MFYKKYQRIDNFPWIAKLMDICLRWGSLGQNYNYQALKRLKHHCLNIKQNWTCSSIYNQTGTSNTQFFFFVPHLNVHVHIFAYLRKYYFTITYHFYFWWGLFQESEDEKTLVWDVEELFGKSTQLCGRIPNFFCFYGS